jgi:uncharacterized protein (TIGR02118 family)
LDTALLPVGIAFSIMPGIGRTHFIETKPKDLYRSQQTRSYIVIRLTVLYGHPTDPAEFDRYYHEVHVPLARAMKGLKGWTIGKCQSITPGEQPPYYLIVGLYAESRGAMESILATPEGQATVADVQNFATGGATFIYNEEEVLIPYRLD